MGIIRAAVDTARGTLADQWLDVVEAGEMGEQTQASARQITLPFFFPP